MNDPKLIIENWEEDKNMGFIKYALLNGAIFGILLFIFNGIIGLFSSPFSDVFISKNSLIYLLIAIALGIVVYAPLMWFINQKIYSKYKKVD